MIIHIFSGRDLILVKKWKPENAEDSLKKN